MWRAEEDPRLRSTVCGAGGARQRAGLGPLPGRARLGHAAGAALPPARRRAARRDRRARLGDRPGLRPALPRAPRAAARGAGLGRAARGRRAGRHDAVRPRRARCGRPCSSKGCPTGARRTCSSCTTRRATAWASSTSCRSCTRARASPTPTSPSRCRRSPSTARRRRSSRTSVARDAQRAARDAGPRRRLGALRALARPDATARGATRFGDVAAPGRSARAAPRARRCCAGAACRGASARSTCEFADLRAASKAVGGIAERRVPRSAARRLPALPRRARISPIERMPIAVPISVRSRGRRRRRQPHRRRRRLAAPVGIADPAERMQSRSASMMRSARGEPALDASA